MRIHRMNLREYYEGVRASKDHTICAVVRSLVPSVSLPATERYARDPDRLCASITCYQHIVYRDMRAGSVGYAHE